MPLKGLIQPDHIPVNKYELIVVGIPIAIAFTTISGMEIEVPAVDLPDRTKATGGQLGTTQFTAQVPMHHTAQTAALETWFFECQDPVSPLYKKAATLTHLSGTGNISRGYSALGIWISKRKLPDLAWADDGEMAVQEYTFEVDSLLPIPAI